MYREEYEITVGDLSPVTCLEITSDVSLVEVLIAYYVMLYIMSPFGTSSIQEMVS